MTILATLILLLLPIAHRTEPPAWVDLFLPLVPVRFEIRDDDPLFLSEVGGALVLGETLCPRIAGRLDSAPLVRLNTAWGRTQYLEVLAHELIHAYDCLDNQRLDGSPLGAHAGHHDPAHRYAAEVLATGRLR